MGARVCEGGSCGSIFISSCQQHDTLMNGGV